MLAIIVLICVSVLSCGKTNTAGAGIDTSTVALSVDSRSVVQASSMRVLVRDEGGQIVDSIYVPHHDFTLELGADYGIEISSDSLFYAAYRVVPTDPIRLSAPLRFFLPEYSEWGQSSAPMIVGQAALQWDSTHAVWYSDSLIAGRHKVTWGVNNLQADLVVNEQASYFERDTGMVPNAGSLRPRNCGFAPWQAGVMQAAGKGCPHVESDSFNRGGSSFAKLSTWKDSILAATLHTATQPVAAANPYSKLLLEFNDLEEPVDLSSFIAVHIDMEIPNGQAIMVRLAQSEQSIAQWYGFELIGTGRAVYTMPLHPDSLSVSVQAKPLQMANIFGLEFRNQVVEQNTELIIHNLHFE
jgi:hypothetical protein